MGIVAMNAVCTFCGFLVGVMSYDQDPMMTGATAAGLSLMAALAAMSMVEGKP